MQKKTERLRYRAEKLESDITVETNVIVKGIESDFKHTNATFQELHVNVERVGINIQHTENKTNDIHELVTEMASDVKELNTMQMAQQESAVIVSSRLIDLIQDQIKGSLCKWQCFPVFQADSELFQGAKSANNTRKTDRN